MIVLPARRSKSVINDGRTKSSRNVPSGLLKSGNAPRYAAEDGANSFPQVAGATTCAERARFAADEWAPLTATAPTSVAVAVIASTLTTTIGLRVRALL